MNRRLAPSGHLAVAVLLLGLLGCASPGGPAATPNVSPTPTPTPTPIPSTTPKPSSHDEPRFLIDCVYPDASPVGTFTRLEEAWASTNYVRIDHCDARAASDDVELTPEEEAVAMIAAKDLPGDAPIEGYLRTLATCVRVAPDASEGIETYPTSLLDAALLLCPEAPHAGLIEAELGSRRE